MPEQNQLLIETLAKKVNVSVSKMVADKQEFKLNSYVIPLSMVNIFQRVPRRWAVKKHKAYILKI